MPILVGEFMMPTEGEAGSFAPILAILKDLGMNESTSPGLFTHLPSFFTLIFLDGLRRYSDRLGVLQIEAQKELDDDPAEVLTNQFRPLARDAMKSYNDHIHAFRRMAPAFDLPQKDDLAALELRMRQQLEAFLEALAPAKIPVGLHVKSYLQGLIARLDEFLRGIRSESEELLRRLLTEVRL